MGEVEKNSFITLPGKGGHSELMPSEPRVPAWGRSVQFSHSVMSDSLRPHGLQDARLPCPSPTPRALLKLRFIESVMPDLSCGSLLKHCVLRISSSAVPFCLQSFPASGSFPVSQFFASGGQSIGTSASASVLPMNIQDFL